MKFEQWNGFTDGSWTDSIDVRGFIQKNYTPYTGDDSFLADATEKTKKLWDIVLDLYKKEKIATRIWNEIEFCKLMRKIRPQSWELEYKTKKK